MNNHHLDIKKINIECEQLSPQQILSTVHKKIKGEKALSLSMQLEGMILLDMLLKQRIPAFFYTIDTGRLPQETYQMMEVIRFQYNIDLHVFYPNHQLLQNLVSKKGLFSFKESVEARRECCFLRKVEPNKRALQGKSIWITGLRKEQSKERQNTQIISYDSKLKVYKIAPLANMKKNDLDRYIKEHKVSKHPLYQQGYASIGCAPCTRPIQPGADERSGRWWWEQGIKECGLHR